MMDECKLWDLYISLPGLGIHWREIHLSNQVFTRWRVKRGVVPSTSQTITTFVGLLGGAARAHILIRIVILPIGVLHIWRGTTLRKTSSGRCRMPCWPPISKGLVCSEIWILKP